MVKNILVIALLLSSGTAISQTKSICITIDDLPVVSVDQSNERLNYITDHLITSLKKENVPAICFVNEIKLVVKGKRSKINEDLLIRWKQNGFELGNHTYSHIDVNTNSMADVEKEIVKGERFTNMLFKDDRSRIKYFRHPFLHKGNTAEKKDTYASLLKKYGYTEAPVTIDNADYIFARAFDIALSKQDSAAMKIIGDAYVPYMISKVAYYENQAAKLFRRNINHILLIHANSINSEYLGTLIDALKKDNYKFASLTATLSDPAYLSADNFIGNAGISWVHRWMISQKKPKEEFGLEPVVPDFVLKYSGFKSE